MSKKKKIKHVRTIGDLEREARERDKRLKKEDEKATINIHLDPHRSRLEQIQELDKNECVSCRKKKSIKKFYALYRPDGRLKKIWPSCRKCMSSVRREQRHDVSAEHLMECFVHYSKQNPKKLACSLCGHKGTNSLTLVDYQYKTKESILTSSRYQWLHEHDFPKMNLKLMCYNCAFKRINKNTKR